VSVPADAFESENIWKLPIPARATGAGLTGDAAADAAVAAAMREAEPILIEERELLEMFAWEGRLPSPAPLSPLLLIALPVRALPVPRLLDKMLKAVLSSETRVEAVPVVEEAAAAAARSASACCVLMRCLAMRRWNCWWRLCSRSRGSAWRFKPFVKI